MTFRVAILTVSDTASKDASADRSGPSIKEIIIGKGFTVIDTRIVPDDEDLIRESVESWSGSGIVDWIITTGGTGLGLRDHTPEASQKAFRNAIKPLLEREAPGIVHLLLSASIARTSFAALSRPVAGTVRGSNVLIITLPGSTKAVRENLDALFNANIIEHALDLLSDGTGKALHDALQRHESVGSTAPILSQRCEHARHDHHHKKHEHLHAHHYIGQLTAEGHRVSPYPLVSYGQALELIFTYIPATGIITKSVSPDLRGTVIAEDVYAPHDIPLTATSNMDGYAVRSSYSPGVYRVATRAHPSETIMQHGHIYRVNTGAPLPSGTDSVVIIEDTELATSNSDGEEVEVRILRQATPGNNVRGLGSDVREGDLVLRKEELLSGVGGEIGTLAFVGRKEVKVHEKPIVAIMSTGNELVDLQGNAMEGSVRTGETWGGIWDTNRPSLQTALIAMGYEVFDLGIAKDNIQAHVEMLKEGLAKADLILTTGGTSMGASDLLKSIIGTHLGGTIHFGRVSIKPGKPTTFATIPVDKSPGKKRTKAIFALPGNPASALVCFYIFVIPALRKMAGWPEKRCQLPRVRVKLLDSLRLDTRMEFHRVIISQGEDGLTARTTGFQRSSRVASLSGANGFVVLPIKQDDGPSELKTGDVAEAIVIGEILME